MKKKIKKIFSFKDKSPYYIANIILISLILFVGIVYSADLINDRFRDIRDDSQYYSDNYFNNDPNASTTEEILPEPEIEETKPDPNEKYNIVITKGTYVEIKDSCGAHFTGTCVRARACPSLSCPTVTSLRDNMVLKTSGQITEADGITWYELVFDEWVRYADRIPSKIYVASDYLKIIETQKETYKKGEKTINETGKKIIVDRSEQKLYAYEDDELFMELSISTGLDSLPTPRGTFQIFDKTPSRYMQGPLPGISDDYYDLPGVPWTMYFTAGGAAIHGAYWHDNFGVQWSHGCVNLRPEDAEILYKWAPIGTVVVVRD